LAGEVIKVHFTFGLEGDAVEQPLCVATRILLRTYDHNMSAVSARLHQPDAVRFIRLSPFEF